MSNMRINFFCIRPVKTYIHVLHHFGIYIILPFSFIIISCNLLNAQKSDNSYRNYRFFEIKGHSGSHLYTGENLKEALKNGYGAIEARYGWQSCNQQNWQGAFGYPAYGFGWYSGFIGNPDLLGTPGALYGFISFPLFKQQRHQMVIEPALGISYDLEPYDKKFNSTNDAIGSRFNVYFNFDIGGNYRLNREMDFIYGIDFTHFSNGRMFKPNAGLNMWGPNIGFRYHFNAKQNKTDNSEFPTQLLQVRPLLPASRNAKAVNISEFSFYGAGGLVQNPEDKGTSKQYYTTTFITEYRYILNEKTAFALGIDYFYDSSLKFYYPEISHWFYGAHVGYDLLFWKMALRIQLGTYLHERGRFYKGNYFLRPALRYDFNRRWFTQIGLKTVDGSKADWVEFGLGLKIF